MAILTCPARRPRRRLLGRRRDAHPVRWNAHKSNAYRGFDLLLKLVQRFATLDSLQMRVQNCRDDLQIELRGSRILMCQSCFRIRDGTGGVSLFPIGRCWIVQVRMPLADLTQNGIELFGTCRGRDHRGHLGRCQPGLPRVWVTGSVADVPDRGKEIFVRGHRRVKRHCDPLRALSPALPCRVTVPRCVVADNSPNACRSSVSGPQLTGRFRVLCPQAL